MEHRHAIYGPVKGVRKKEADMAKEVDKDAKGARSRRTFDSDEIVKMAEGLDSLPHMEQLRPLTKVQALKKLGPQIAALRKKQYTTQEILQALGRVGLEISKSQLHRAYPTNSVVHNRASRSGDGTTADRRKAQTGGAKGTANGISADRRGGSQATPDFQVKPDRLKI